jgi:hypothetical protein
MTSPTDRIADGSRNRLGQKLGADTNPAAMTLRRARARRQIRIPLQHGCPTVPHMAYDEHELLVNQTRSGTPGPISGR